MEFADVVILKYDEKMDSEFIKSLFPKETYMNTQILCSTQAISYFTKLNEETKKKNENKKRILRHQIYGLLIDDKKMNDYIKTKQGIIIVIPYNVNYIQNSLNKIKHIINENKTTPIMIIIDNMNMNMNMTHNANNELIDNKIIDYDMFNVEYRKTFYYSELSINKNDPHTWFTYIMTKYYKQKENNDLVYTDDMLMSLFNLCILPMNVWNHENRLKIVFIHLQKYGYDNCINQNGFLCKSWIKYKDSIGHKDLWNYTITRFYVTLLYKLMINNNYNSFDKIWYNNNYLHDGKLFLQYYSKDKLFTEYAKNNWVEPNIKNI
jgi:hypothetical protein